jgi:hypothetical protein
MNTRNRVFVLVFWLLSSGFLHAQIDHWEKLFGAHDYWKYKLGTSNPAWNWTSTSFNDASWLSGQGSIGYGDNDDSTVISNVPSIYMRRSFQVNQLSDIEALVLHADFDDGFVAYLNGVEIARANVDIALPDYNSPPASSRESTTHNGAATWMGGVPGAWVIQDSVWQGVLQAGTNVFAVHTLDSANTWDLTTKYWLHCGISSTNLANIAPENWFQFDLFDSPVGIMRINTYGTDITENNRIRGTLATVWNPSGGTNTSASSADDVYTNILIKKRGQFSLQAFPKHGYAIESQDRDWEDTDISPLGLPEEEDWVLHGPFGDRSLMRNAVAFHLARETGHYASKSRYVELFINGEYEGLYLLLEKIKRDKNRVDIAKLKEDEISGDDLSGGYIWRQDWGDEDWLSNTNLQNGNAIPYQYVYPKPEDIVIEQQTYLQAAVDSFEQALENTGAPYMGKYWDEYIDMNSFVDYFLTQELTRNVDGYRASTYFHKDKHSKDAKIKAGPVWDFNFSLGLTASCFGWKYDGWAYDGICTDLHPEWWEKLANTPAFADAVNCRWKELKSSVWHPDTLVQLIDEQENLLAPAAQRDYIRWPIDSGTTPAQVYYVDSTFSGNVAIVRDFLVARIGWLDSNMIGTDCAIGIQESLPQNPIALYPNPASEVATFESALPFESIIIRDLTGHEVYRFTNPHGLSRATIELSSFAQGLYICEVHCGQLRFVKKLMVTH